MASTNPLTPKGRKILAAMKREYGAKKGTQIFYASRNAGRITSVDESSGRTEFKPGDYVSAGGAKARIVFVYPEYEDDGSVVAASYRIQYLGWGGEYATVRAKDVKPLPQANPVGGSFVHEHPWMTFFIVLAGISTVGAVLSANR